MIPILLLPVRIINPITDKFEGDVKLSITPINFSAIKGITEDTTTGLAVIEGFNTPGMTSSNIYVDIPFIKFLDTFNSMRIVDFVHMDDCVKHSEPLKDYIAAIKEAFEREQQLNNLVNLTSNAQEDNNQRQ